MSVFHQYLAKFYKLETKYDSVGNVKKHFDNFPILSINLHTRSHTVSHGIPYTLPFLPNDSWNIVIHKTESNTMITLV